MLYLWIRLTSAQRSGGSASSPARPSASPDWLDILPGNGSPVNNQSQWVWWLGDGPNQLDQKPGILSWNRTQHLDTTAQCKFISKCEKRGSSVGVDPPEGRSRRPEGWCGPGTGWVPAGSPGPGRWPCGSWGRRPGPSAGWPQPGRPAPQSWLHVTHPYKNQLRTTAHENTTEMRRRQSQHGRNTSEWIPFVSFSVKELYGGTKIFWFINFLTN